MPPSPRARRGACAISFATKVRCIDGPRPSCGISSPIRLSLRPRGRTTTSSSRGSVTGARRSPTCSSTRTRQWSASRSSPPRRLSRSGRAGRRTRPVIHRVDARERGRTDHAVRHRPRRRRDRGDALRLRQPISQPLAVAVAASAGSCGRPTRERPWVVHGSALRQSTCRPATDGGGLHGATAGASELFMLLWNRVPREQRRGRPGTAARPRPLAGEDADLLEPEARRSSAVSNDVRAMMRVRRGGERLKRLRRSAEWRLGRGAVRRESCDSRSHGGSLVVVRGLLPAAFAIAMGVLGRRGRSTATRWPLR